MTTCVHPDCTGTYDEDGYCDYCGRPAPELPVRPDIETEPTAALPSGPSGTPSAPGSRPITGPNRPTVNRNRDGLIELEPVVRHNPESVVLTDPQVPPARRVCRKCGQPPRRDYGFCRYDGTPYSFVPRLSPGERVGTDRRYEVRGCLAYGGFGWIHLAWDTHLDTWIVLKGLIDAGDPDAVASALNERRFLVEVNHPNIVKIQDFVQHPDPHTHAMIGYIVMEYLPGRTLQDIFLRHHGPDGERAPLPLPTVLTYGVEVLRALGYLHHKGLVFCDLKPDNVMQVDQQVKLIDLGAVLHLTDRKSPVFGTRGFQAPELEREEAPADPSVASDLYTVGRMLAVLSIPFAGFSKDLRHRLPDPAEVPLLRREESFHRLLRRATHLDPRRRFSSADELREQLLGVLAEGLSAEDGQPRPARSLLFTPERRAFGTDAGAVSVNGEADRPVDWTTLPHCLPTPLVDQADPAAGFLATLGVTEPDELVDTLLAAPLRSPEVVLRLIDARVAAGDVAGAKADLAEFERLAPADWRAQWYRGLVAVAGNRPATAREAFDAVYDALPGELAPKLALAAAAEWHGDEERAGTLYERVWRTDTAYVSAAFGLARVLRRVGRLPEVIEALDGVPRTSSEHVFAQVAAIRARLTPRQVAKADLRDAATRLKRLQMDIERQARLSVEVLTAKLNWVLAQGADAQVDHDFNERQLRRELEKAYRNLAKVADDPDDRSRWVDRANQVRPKTLL